ncbi:MAG: lipid-binding protein [Flavobacterium sp. BFFFF2]|nr:MAG: lipid-binding protein [Flavobacterium sp. BFFFF2]
MKNLKTFVLALLVAVGATQVQAQTKKVDAAKSKINWVGKKVTGEHSGTVNVKDGNLVFKGTALKGGTITVDMTSLTATDLSGEYQQKLNGHLKAEDFFGTDKFATSKIVFKKVADKGNGVFAVTADLTIKDMTNPITFDLTVKGDKATADLKVDRTKFGIKYGSGSFFDNLGDKTINDEFELKVALVL